MCYCLLRMLEDREIQRTIVGQAAGGNGGSHEAEAGGADQWPQGRTPEVGASAVHARRPLLAHRLRTYIHGGDMHTHMVDR